MKLRHPGVKRAATTLVAAGLLGGLMLVPLNASAQSGSLVRQVADGKVHLPTLGTGAGARQAAGFSGSLLTAARLGVVGQDERDEEADANPNDIAALAISPGTLGCRSRNTDGNVRVNQDCTFRRQAEEIIKINPSNPQNIIAGQNDSRVGYNKCGFDFSLDGGQHWGDGLPPFFQRENHPEADGPVAGSPNNNTILGVTGTAHTYDAASDPAETFDSAGRAFFSCVVFDVHTNASGVLATQSPQGAAGSFYDNVNNPPQDPNTGAFVPTAASKRFVVVEDNATPTSTRIALHDKEFIAADAFSGSPNRDNVYVTWTVFIFDVNCISDINPGGECSSAIYGSMSTDHAQTWSTPEEISGSSPLCANSIQLDPTRPANACDIDQGSDPQPMADGSLVVPFMNQNTAVPKGQPFNPNNQQLAVVCHPSGSSTSGTAHLNCGAPSKVGDDIANGEPLCNFGRGPEECVPGPWIRTNDFPRVGLDKSNKSLFVVWQDYRNGEYDIQISRSNNAGTTWKEGGTVNPGRYTDHYMPAVDIGSDHDVAVSYFRSNRVPNENTIPTHSPDVCGANPPGNTCFMPGDPGVQKQPSAYLLAGREQSDPDTETPFAAVRLSPEFPPPDGNQAGFNGDYSGLAVHDNTAHPVWSDTRNTVVVTSPAQGVVHDEDVFTDSRAIPDRGNED